MSGGQALPPVQRGDTKVEVDSTLHWRKGWQLSGRAGGCNLCCGVEGRGWEHRPEKREAGTCHLVFKNKEKFMRQVRQERVSQTEGGV